MKRVNKRLIRWSVIFAIMASIIVGANFYFGCKVTRNFYEEYPNYFSAEDKYAQANMIREYVYEHATYAGDERVHSNQYTSFFSNVLRRLKLGNYTTYQELSGGGMLCGGISATLCDVFTLLGYNSCTVDFAVFDEDTVIFSHVITAVEINDEWIIEDATYNVTYSDIKDNPISINKVQTFLKRNDNQLIKQVSGVKKWRPCIISGEIDDYLGNYRIEEVNGRLMVNMTNLNYQDDFIRCFSYFMKDGYEADALYMFLYPYDIYDMNRRAFSVQELPELVY